MLMCVRARWSALCGRRRGLGGFCTSKEKPSASPGCNRTQVVVSLVSSGDVCGKKTNPCGEDAACNQTNVPGVCRCKAGFQRSQESGQCEGHPSIRHAFPILDTRTVSDRSNVGWIVSVSEVNECLQMDTCPHYCTNTKGSFKCTCDRNYKDVNGNCVAKGSC